MAFEDIDPVEASTVAYTIEDNVAWVSFNRPDKRNCMSPRLNRQMMRVLDELEFRTDVGALVLTGEGSAWTAGMDLKEYFRETEAEAVAFAVCSAANLELRLPLKTISASIMETLTCCQRACKTSSKRLPKFLRLLR